MPLLTWLSRIMTNNQTDERFSDLTNFVCFYRLIKESHPSRLTILAKDKAAVLGILLSTAKVSRVEQLYSVVILEDIGNGSSKEVFTWERDKEESVLANVVQINRIRLNKREKREQKRLQKEAARKAWFASLLEKRETNTRNVLVKRLRVVMEKSRDATNDVKTN